MLLLTNHVLLTKDEYEEMFTKLKVEIELKEKYKLFYDEYCESVNNAFKEK